MVLQLCIPSCFFEYGSFPVVTYPSLLTTTNLYPSPGFASTSLTSNIPSPLFSIGINFESESIVEIAAIAEAVVAAARVSGFFTFTSLSHMFVIFTDAFWVNSKKTAFASGNENNLKFVFPVFVM